MKISVNEMMNSDQQQNKTINKEEEEDEEDEEEQLRKYYKEITLDIDYFNQSIYTNKILQEYNEWS